MIGVLEVKQERGRRPLLEERRLMGLRCLWATVPVAERVSEKRRLRRVKRGARSLVQAGVRRVLTAAAFPYWDALNEAGLQGVDPEAFSQALAVPLTLAALVRQDCAPEQAAVLLSGRWVDHAMFRAAETLCPMVRHLSVDAGDEGEELADWLRAEFGAAVRPAGGTEANVALCFGPEIAPARTVFRLWGPEPDLAGFLPVLAAGGLPSGLDRLPLLALLWEEGRVSVKQLRILPPNSRQLT